MKDAGKSVILIEKKGRLGGHTETYTDPATDTPIDYGVVVFENIPVVNDYFKRFNIPLAPSTFGAGRSESYDFRSGEKLTLEAPTAEIGIALSRYAAQLAKYPKLDDGQFLPNPVPADLLLPFGDFVKKYQLEALVRTFYSFLPGVGDLLSLPTVEVMRYCGTTLVGAVSTGDFLATARRNNSELYGAAEAELRSTSSLLINSEVLFTDRRNGNKRVLLFVKTPTGFKAISAKKLVIAIPPKLDFLAPLNPDSQENKVFSRFVNAGYYAGILKNSGIPDDLTVGNFAENTTFNLPDLPATYNFVPTGIPDLHAFYYGTPRTSRTSSPLPDDVVQVNIIADLKRIQAANPYAFEQTEPDFAVYSSHAPFFLHFDAEDTKRGYYDKMYKLQGKRNTFWTGAAWRTHDSSQIWKYTKEQVLPKLLAQL